MTGEILGDALFKHIPELLKYLPEFIKKTLDFKSYQEGQARYNKVNFGKNQISLEGYGTDDVLKLLGSSGFQQAITRLNTKDDQAEI
jgi:hypothetical protein